MLQNLRLSIVDGTVCVASTTTDWNAPRLITNHWPTTVRARDLANFLDVSELELLSATVLSLPGEYYVKNPGHRDGTHCFGMSGAYVSLTHGGRTQPVKTDLVPYPAPKNRGRKVEYRDGYWHVETAKGWKRHEVM